MGGRKKWTVIGTAVLGAVGLVGAQAGLPARAATAAVSPGIATAGGSLLGVIPGVSGLTLTTTYGEARAAYEETQSEATSATVDLGGLGYFLANEPTCGNTFPVKDLPQPLTANSGAGNAHKTGGYGTVGAEAVSVSQTPEQALADTAITSESLTGLLDVSGRSTAAVHYLKGTEQQAYATVTEDIEILGGLVELKGATWTASWRAGTATTTLGDFSLGQVTINHVPVRQGTPPAAVMAAVNAAINPLGFTMTPSSRTSTASSVTVAPIVLRFSGSQIERTAINPSVGAVTQLEAEINSRAQAGQDCSKVPQLLYNVGNNLNSEVNLALAIAQGTGSLNFALGGANAGVQDLPGFTNPFGLDNPATYPVGDSGPPSILSQASSVVSLPPGTVTSPSISAAANVPSSIGSTPAPAAQVPAPLPAVIATSCRTTSPAGSPGCWRGVATLAAAVLVVGGSGVFAADVFYGRRRRRRRRSLEERRAAL